MRDVTCVILAAGAASRYGADKLALPFGDGTVLDAVVRACHGFPYVVVAGKRTDTIQDERTIVNDEPDRGMAHSLRLANDEIPPKHTLAVLLGDKPLVTAGLVRGLLAHRDEADVVYPVRSGVAGHPVIFSPKARSRIRSLPDGDNIRLLRDDPQLTRLSVTVDDDGAFTDVDTEEDYRRIISASE